MLNAGVAWAAPAAEPVASGLARANAETLLRWTDDAGQAWAVPARLPQRWVVLGPHLVDMMIALKQPHLIVGVQDDHPTIGRWSRSLSGFPVIAQASQINEEFIRRVKPDLVLYWPSGLAGNQQARLRLLGVPLLAIDPQRLDDIAPRLRWLGALTGRPRTADKLATVMQADLQRTRQRYAKGYRLRGLYQVWLQPLYSLAPQHLASQAMQLCGVDSIVPPTKVPAPILSLEFVVRARPDVILLSQDQLEPSRRYWQRFQQMPANALVVVDDHALTRPGLSLLRAIPALCDQLLPYRALPR
ncbi:MAG: hypothetical protein AABY68_05460 [Pseudomonadota bacterium]